MFKSKAINAQGTRLFIDDGVGLGPETITAVTKADPAVVTHIDASGPHAVGDIIRFGEVDGMPEIAGMTALATASVAGTLTTNLDTSGFAAAGTDGEFTTLVFVAGCEVKTFSGFDGQSAEIDITTLCSDAREYLVGLQDFGAFNFDVNLVPNDPFQVECMEAKADREKRTFRLVLPEGEDGTQFEYVFDAFVRQFTISGGVDQALVGSVVLRVTGEPQLIEITP